MPDSVLDRHGWKEALASVCFLLTCLSAWAQPPLDPPARDTSMLDKVVIRDKSVLLKTGASDMITRNDVGTYFPNVNEMAYFEDEKILKRIQNLERKGKFEDEDEAYLREFDKVLGEYVQQFAVDNFREDLLMVWMAGRVRELLEDTTRAIYFYELAKMHDRGREIPRLRLDSLLSPTESEWLPIDKYYELLEIRQKIDPLVPPKKVLEPMGDQINSSDPDYAPFMHPTDSILVFTSRRDTSGIKSEYYVDPFKKSNEDLYIAEIDFISGGWKEAERLSDTINTEFNEGSACLAPDGLTLYFTRCREGRGFGNCDIYQATYDPVTGAWGHVQNLGSKVNSRSWDSQPNITPDGRTLFFASNRKGGFGGTDLYYTVKGENGRWGRAQNLGPLINTPDQEVTPFYHQINSTLYFSSTGHLTKMGSYDIFKSRWLGDRWEVPHNVGPFINTNGNEYYFTINSSGTEIFYANSREHDIDHIKQDFDLYSFPMPMEARPDAIAKLKGVLIDSVSGHPLQGTVMIIDLEEGVEVAPKLINKRGYFEFDLIDERRYRIFVLGENFLTIKNDIVVKGDTSFTVLTRSFEEGRSLVFESMEFRSNSARLKSDVKPNLDYVVRFLTNYPMFKLKVEGHTDSDGKPESNQRLSEARAATLADYISRKGEFDEGRVTSEGFGETRPLVPNDSEENKRKNRRVEFKLILDEAYDGEMWLPSEDELFFDDEWETPPDPEFDDEFDWGEGEADSWESELDMEEMDDLDEELEADLLERLEPVLEPGKKPAPTPTKKKTGKGKTTSPPVKKSE